MLRTPVSSSPSWVVNNGSDHRSLLSRQRDGELPSLFGVAERMPGAGIRILLNTFNDQWVQAAQFFSPALLLELLRLSGDWTAGYYAAVDPMLAGEPVPLFDPAPGEQSPFWHAIGREYLERWTHHSQIRRALDLPSLASSPFLDMGAQIIAAAASVAPTAPSSSGGDWQIGPLTLGPTQQAVDIMTLAHTEQEVRAPIDGPAELADQFAARTGRRP
jgi:hypothetical protein